MPEDSHPGEMVREWRKRHKQLIKPVLVDAGPCKENIAKGNDVDLF